MLVIADEAELTVMSPALDVGSSAFLTESCASAVLVGEKHFVCGPANDWERQFYVYDVGVEPPTQIAVSAQSFTYDGIQMVRVPGTDSFITLESSYNLFEVAADTGQTSIAAESPFNTEGTLPIAFDGTPPAHLIQTNGNMLALSGPGCSPPQTTTSCFTQAGVLGILRTGQGFVGLGDNGAGQVAAVVSQSGTTFNPFGAPCTSGYRVDAVGF